MNNEEKIKRLNIEDFIWIIYLFISIFALISNRLDRKYLLDKDISSYKKEKIINITIFIIALFIYLYFLYLNLEDLKTSKNKKEYNRNITQVIAAFLFLIGGFIYLYNEITYSDINEIGLI